MAEVLSIFSAKPCDKNRLFFLSFIYYFFTFTICFFPTPLLIHSAVSFSVWISLPEALYSILCLFSFTTSYILNSLAVFHYKSLPLVLLTSCPTSCWSTCPPTPSLPFDGPLFYIIFHPFSLSSLSVQLASSVQVVPRQVSFIVACLTSCTVSTLSHTKSYLCPIPSLSHQMSLIFLDPLS